MILHGIPERKPIDGIYPIRYHILLASLLICAFLVTALVPGKGIAAPKGSISGKVHEYLKTTTPIYGIQVTVFNESNSPVKSVKTDPNAPYDPNSNEPKWLDGYFKITDLPVGKYRVCAMGPTYTPAGDAIYWVSECFENRPACKEDPNCGYYITEYPEDFANTLVEVEENLTTTNVNFYLARAGEISGDVYTLPGYKDFYVSYKVTVKYKDNPSHVLPLYTSASKITSTGYKIVNCPSGDYIIRIQDWIQITNPYDAYYITQYWSQKYVENQATLITLGCGKDNLIAAKNFQMIKGGVIQGYIKKYDGTLTPPNTRYADVVLIENDLGYMQSMQTNQFPDLGSPIDPNGDFIPIFGKYKFGGLSPGNYALYAELVGAQDANNPDPEPPNLGYLSEFYNDFHFGSQLDPSYEAQITYITIKNQGDVINIDLVLDLAPQLSGTVTRTGTTTALPGIEIRINGPSIAYTKTNSSGYYEFTTSELATSKKLLPGLYTISAWDPNAIYEPIEANITMAVNQQYTKNFSMKVAPTGIGMISGRVFLDDDPAKPIEGIKVKVHHILLGNEYDDTTDENGEYTIEGVRTGYVLVVTEGDSERAIMSRVYKDLNIPPTEFQQYPEGWDQMLDYAGTQRRLYLDVDDPNTGIGIDIGVSSYKRTFHSGLNLYGYPGEPVVEYATAYKLVKGIGDHLHKLLWRNDSANTWNAVWLNLADPNHPPVGVNCSITPGKGYVIFMNETVDSMVLPPFTITIPDFYTLVSGKNLISYPPSLYRPLRTSSDLISAISDPDAVASVRSYDSFTGRWKSHVRMWGRSCSGEFPLRQGEAYIVEMKSPSSLYIPIPPQ